MTIQLSEIPVVSVEKMRQVDSLMENKYRISLIQMMEHAGRNLAELTRQLLLGEVVNKKIVILTGKGNNGGGGLVAARHLHNWCAEVTILSEAPPAAGVPALQWSIMEKLSAKKITGNAALDYLEIASADFILDALFGYNLNRPLEGWSETAVRLANDHPAPILALDIPSGLHPDTGEALGIAVRAAATMTLALPKEGLLKPSAECFVGDLYLADISVPIELYREIGIPMQHVFTHESIISLSNQSKPFWNACQGHLLG